MKQRVMIAMALAAEPEILMHWIDQMIGSLYEMRNKIKDRSDDLLETFIGVWEARARWIQTPWELSITAPMTTRAERRA